MTLNLPTITPGTPPFDSNKLDQLMDEAGLDLLLVTSKHNVQYLLGGHRSSFFHFMDAVGTSRFLPIFVYVRGCPEKSAYFGHKLEKHDRDNRPFWVNTSTVSAFGIEDATQAATDYIVSLGVKTDNIGIETGFLPVEAYIQLRSTFADAAFEDALFPLERIRAIKTPWEIQQMKIASEEVVASMLATFEQIEVGMSKAQIIRLLQIEEVKRNLTFEYCWLSVGPSLNRTASDQAVRKGDPISIDSGANYSGYVGDLARMAIIGDPDAELVDLLAQIEAVQQTAFKILAPGRTGREIHVAAAEILGQSSIAPHSHFVAHGMGLISHEAPRLTSQGPIRYDGYDADKSLEPGMVVSVETTVADPKRGAVKLEDSLLITETGHEFLGEGARGWNRTGG